VRPLGWLKPEYIFRPTQLVRRIGGTPLPDAPARLSLPGGLPILADPRHSIGRSLRTLGVFDLVVTETLWRLLDPGGWAVDVGANIGYMAGVMARRIHPGGRLFCFEPHPEVFAQLVENTTHWERLLRGVQFCRFQRAASSERGRATLLVPAGFATNQGLARLARPGESVEGGIQVESVRLDEALVDVSRVDLMKLDVEGHEFEALSGASRLLGRHQVRDVVFEEHGAYPTPASDLLEHYGYQVFRLTKTLLGPRLSDPRGEWRRSEWEPASYLATVAAGRAKERMRSRGWRVLGSRAAGGLAAAQQSD